MIAAFAYLVLHSARNRAMSQLRRIRNPRYAIALLLGIAYFWFVFFKRSTAQGRDITSPLGADTLAVILPIGLLLYSGYSWIVGADRSALAFSQAEVSMLFPAPVSRRGLILFKLARSQGAVLTSSLIWAILFARGHGTLAMAVGYWILLSIVSMHRLGVALIRASQHEHGAHGLKQSWPAMAIFVCVVATVAMGLLGARGQVTAAAGLGDKLHAIAAAFAAPPLSWVLFPFRVAALPVITPPGMAWLRAVVPALGLLALHLWWVLRSDAAFEEAAADASVARAKRVDAMRRRGETTINAKTAGRTLPLAPTGPPAVALVWKNYLWLVRTGQLRSLVALPVAALVAVLIFIGRSESAEAAIFVLCGALAVSMLVIGPLGMRNDLRGELRRLPMIRTLPLSGRHIILAEVMSSASVIAALQLALVIVGIFATFFIGDAPFPLPVRVGMLVAAPVFLLGLNLANFTIHNAFALLLPGWVRLGETTPGGVEAMGQMMLTTGITLLMLALLLLAPAGLAAVAYFWLRPFPGLSIAAPGIVAGVVLCAEAYVAAVALGGTLERTEPMHVQ